MEYSFFVTNVVKHVVVPDFGQKNSGRFRGGASTQNPEKAYELLREHRLFLV